MGKDAEDSVWTGPHYWNTAKGELRVYDYLGNLEKIHYGKTYAVIVEKMKSESRTARRSLRTPA